MPIINACKIESQPLEIWLLTAHMKKQQLIWRAWPVEFFILGERVGGVRISFFIL